MFALPVFDPIRDTPRFRSVIEENGLTPFHAKCLHREPHTSSSVAGSS
jgi:hypothetical protein